MNFYPFYEELQEEAQSFNINKGNFSLWFNKILFNVDSNGKLIDDTNWAKNIYEKYKKISENKKTQELLKNKIKNQKDFAKQFFQKYKFIQLEGKLKSDFIIGLGESHPTELGMILDHLIGVPYIPASTIKGAVRFAYSLNYIDRNKNDLPQKNGELIEKDTPITKLFGGENKETENYIEKVGKIIFLDSYSEKTLKLKLDIMTPHYGKYYSEKIAPADNQEPNPIKFLAIEKGQKFIFNVLIDNDIVNEKDNIINAFKRALEVEGIGAKTAVGYGRFEVKVIEHKSKEEEFQEKVHNYIEKIDKKIFNFDLWKNDKDESIRNCKKIAQKILDLKLVKPKKSNGEFSNNFKTLAKILEITPQELLNKSKPNNNLNDTEISEVNEQNDTQVNNTQVIENKRRKGKEEAERYIEEGEIKKKEFKRINRKYDLSNLNPDLYKQLEAIKI